MPRQSALHKKTFMQRGATARRELITPDDNSLVCLFYCGNSVVELDAIRPYVIEKCIGKSIHAFRDQVERLLEQTLVQDELNQPDVVDALQVEDHSHQLGHVRGDPIDQKVIEKGVFVIFGDELSPVKLTQILNRTCEYPVLEPEGFILSTYTYERRHIQTLQYQTKPRSASR